MKLLVVIMCWIGAFPLFSSEHDDIPLVPMAESTSESEVILSGPHILKLFNSTPPESLRSYLEAPERSEEDLSAVITIGSYFSLRIRKSTVEAACYTLLQLLFDGGLVRAAEGKPDTSAIVCLSIVAGITAVVTVFKWRAAYKKRQTKKDLATNVETIRTANPTVYDVLKTAFTENPNLRLILPSTSKARREELRSVVTE